ncbi:hypothetical protein [Mesoflavibacter profundi]|uniref:hypothetical protein n=1 Tax=Mesoflavibacter profundi TaxID=2708110 RepID=UPI0035156024
MKLVQIKANQINQLTLEQKYQLAIKLGTTAGFYQYYFDSLPNHKNQIETFNNANDLYYSIYKQYKYTGYDSFRNALNYYLKNNK